MTDQELIARLRLQSEHIPVRTLFDDAADRIEELVKERDDLGRRLNTARYGQPDFAWSIHEEEMADLRFKLTKAMEALRWAYDTLKEINTSNYTHDDACELNAASVEVILGIHNLLAKLEGK